MSFTKTLACVHKWLKLCFNFYSISILLNNFFETSSKASYVQLSNQSIVQQFTKEGNFLARILSASPAGLMHKIMWRFERMFEIKYDHNDSGLSTFFFFNAFGRTLFMISSISSFFLNKFGTYPVFSMLLILSKNYS